jgi:hypothetical protein
MDQPAPTTDNPYVARMKAAAYERWTEETAERRQVEEIVLGKNPGRDRTGDAVKLGDDWVVEVCRRDGSSTWTTVVDGKRGLTHHYTQEMAVLELVARRYDDNPNTSPMASAYAGRVLGIPADQH